MNNIAAKLQKCWTHKIAFNIISKMLKQPNYLQSDICTSEGSTCKVLPFYDLFYDRFCSPNLIVNFLLMLITEIENCNLNLPIIQEDYTLHVPPTTGRG